MGFFKNLFGKRRPAPTKADFKRVLGRLPFPHGPMAFAALLRHTPEERAELVDAVEWFSEHMDVVRNLVEELKEELEKDAPRDMTVLPMSSKFIQE